MRTIEPAPVPRRCREHCRRPLFGVIAGVVFAAAALGAAPVGAQVSDGFAVRLGPPDKANGRLTIYVELPGGISGVEAIVDYDGDGFDSGDPKDSAGGEARPSVAVGLFGFYYLWEYGRSTAARVIVNGTDGSTRTADFDVSIEHPVSRTPTSGVRGGRGVVTSRAVGGLRLGSADEADVVALAGPPTRSTTIIDGNFFHENFHALGYGPCRTKDPQTCQTYYELRFVNFGQRNAERTILDGFSTGSARYRTSRGTRKGILVSTMRRRERGEKREHCFGSWVLQRRLMIGVSGRRVTGLSIAGRHTSLFFVC